VRLALIGFGVMGQLVGRLAADQGHEVVVSLCSRDSQRSLADLAGALSAADVAIDFSTAAAVPKTVTACIEAGVPLAEGTTGWHAHLDEIKKAVELHHGALIYGANFSVGVQVFYRIAKRAAELFSDLESYDCFIEEMHHKRKRDAPSGTALQLKELVTKRLTREVPVTSMRAGYVPGTHRLGFDSSADQVLLSHEARSREGFASGALMAARWIIGRRGVYEFSDMFEQILQERKREL
jgi:4-hydroxy-tetrahydrodipicolinate reductase